MANSCITNDVLIEPPDKEEKFNKLYAKTKEANSNGDYSVVVDREGLNELVKIQNTKIGSCIPALIGCLIVENDILVEGYLQKEFGWLKEIDCNLTVIDVLSYCTLFRIINTFPLYMYIGMQL